MSHVRYGLLWLGRASKSKITEIDKLIIKALRCIHLRWNEGNNSIKIDKNTIDVKNLS